MVDEKICELRDKLNTQIVSGEDYKNIYKTSVELDDLIAKYYRDRKVKNKKNIIRRKLQFVIL